MELRWFALLWSQRACRRSENGAMRASPIRTFFTQIFQRANQKLIIFFNIRRTQRTQTYKLVRAARCHAEKEENDKWASSDSAKVKWQGTMSNGSTSFSNIVNPFAGVGHCVRPTATDAFVVFRFCLASVRLEHGMCTRLHTMENADGNVCRAPKTVFLCRKQLFIFFRPYATRSPFFRKNGKGIFRFPISEEQKCISHTDTYGHIRMR